MSDKMNTNKSLWSRLSTSINLFYHNNIKNKSKKEKICYICITFFLFIYLFITFYLSVDIPYWIGHGIKFHQQHFHWTATFDGQYCGYKPLKTHNGNNLWEMSQNNTNFHESRSRVLLLSYPRSGNHLTRAMIECLLQKPTYGYAKETHTVYIKREISNQSLAIKVASIETPFIRKIHTPHAIPAEFEQERKTKDMGLIYLIRDPIECILSENKYVPYFWKDYQYQFGVDFFRSPTFYQQWKNDESKLLLYYEDYYNNDGTPNSDVNLRKLARYFGPEMVKTEQLNYCIDNYDKVIEIGLGSLQRTSTSSHNPHYYRDKYFGKNPENWPKIKVSKDLYHIFSRYDDIASC